jgi:peptidyl-prolyl cis-trans isomerase C
MTQFSETPWTRAALLAALALVATACNKPSATADAPAADKPSSPTIATVDGHAITRADFDFYVKQLTQNRGPIELTPDQKNQVLEQLITMQVMSAQAVKDHVDAEPETVAALDVTRMNLLADGEAKKYLKDHQPTDQELRAAYDEETAALGTTEYHARHILVKDEALAKALIKKIQGGAKFEDVAKANSIDPSGKNTGGDLPWFTPARMVKPFSDAVKTLKKGEMTTTPVQTQYGWHIIKLEDTRPLVPQPFDQVKDQISKRVIPKKLDAYFDELKKTAKIEKMPIDPVPAGQPMVGQPAASAAPAQP